VDVQVLLTLHDAAPQLEASRSDPKRGSRLDNLQPRNFSKYLDTVQIYTLHLILTLKRLLRRVAHV
jgi:hypothetical protein